jgi:hypothetical protein
MVTSEDIPIEIRARVEANALFDAIQIGDYKSAAQAQERLRVLGWHVSREPASRRRASRCKSRQKPDGWEGGSR